MKLRSKIEIFFFINNIFTSYKFIYDYILYVYLFLVFSLSYQKTKLFNHALFCLIYMENNRKRVVQGWIYMQTDTSLHELINLLLNYI